MGLLARLFSLGTNRRSKNKKLKRSSELGVLEEEVDAEGRIVQREEQRSNANANRLQRSTSARYAMVTEADYADLPSLRNPMNDFAPQRTIGRSTITLQRSNTYSVRVHERTLHSRTEFPNANPRLSPHGSSPPATPSSSRFDSQRSRMRQFPETPVDQGRLHALRRDPSVASLLSLYDHEGRLDAKAFSNTPPSNYDNRGSVRRSGSTLRQLLGDPVQSQEDITWAEQFLQEAEVEDASSSTDSLPLKTPPEADTALSLSLDASSRQIAQSMTHDHSHETSLRHPEFSSLNGEVSGVASGSRPTSWSDSTHDPKTPPRASDVFGFLTDRRKMLRERPMNVMQLHANMLKRYSTGTMENHDPSSSSSVDTTPSPLEASTSRLPPSPPPAKTPSAVNFPAAQASLTGVPFPAPTQSTSLSRSHSNASSHAPDTQYSDAPQDSDALTRSRTASHYSTADDSAAELPDRVVRGPRPRRQNRLNISQNDLLSDLLNSSQSDLLSDLHAQLYDNELKASLSGSSRQAKSNIPRLKAGHPVGARKRRPRSRANSISNALNSGISQSSSHQSSPGRAARNKDDKENSTSIALSPKSIPVRTRKRSSTTPATPLHTRSIFEQRYADEAPSPASSSELSPVAREMMTTARKQRTRARDMEKRSTSRKARAW